MPESAHPVRGGWNMAEVPNHFRDWHFAKGNVRGAGGANSIGPST
ncbi:uncharacterized protein METZ01_LOCUS238196 [marine metagenome]|uniref:Uncharacterized protein n=1 Tax=marine metagenome TaxID=408172 RepID=A0A382HDW8_9ZZZZ